MSAPMFRGGQGRDSHDVVAAAGALFGLGAILLGALAVIALVAHYGGGR